jgi:hypothetical protein
MERPIEFLAQNEQLLIAAYNKMVEYFDNVLKDDK